MTFHIKENNTSPPLKVELQDEDENPKDVSGSTVTMIMSESDTDVEKINNSANVSFITDGSDGQVKYEWQTGDTDTPGYYDVEFEVEYVSGEFETFPNSRDIEVIIHEAVQQ